MTFFVRFFYVAILLFTLGFSSCAFVPKDFLGQGDSKSETVKTKEGFRLKPTKASLFNIPYRSLDSSKLITRFGFGSYNDHKLPQPMWKNILDDHLDLFVMMGDNVYAPSTTGDETVIDQYIKLNENESYRNLREEVPFLAMWNENDFGQVDGGADNPHKKTARSLFLSYWGYIKPSIPRDQDAIYHSRIVGPKKQKVQFIMLDTRWDRSPLTKQPEQIEATTLEKKYAPSEDPKAQILSDKQWAWLKSELQKPAELRFIVSSIQVLPNDHMYEKWGNFPTEREKLLNMLRDLKLKNVFFLSGDRRLAAMSKLNLSANENKPQFVYELTSSSLNSKSTSALPETDSVYIQPSFLDINYGLAQIDWNKKAVKFEIMDEKNQPQQSLEVKF